MLSDIDLWRYNYGAMTANSAYRNPAHNAAINGTHNSRHMHGDAIDVANPTRNQTGRAALIAALPGGSSYPDYIEPTQLACGLACVHADWRNHSQTYAHTYIAQLNVRKQRQASVAQVSRARNDTNVFVAQVHSK